MTPINLGECNKNMIYSIIGGLSNLFVSVVLFLFKDEVELNKHPFMLGINAGFGMSLAIIPYIYILKYSKTNQEKQLNNNNYINQFLKRSHPIGKKQKYFILFLCAFLDFLQKLLVFIFSNRLTNDVWVFDIIFLNAFSYMIKKNPLYKHQFFSSGIMIVFGIGLNVFHLYNMKVEDIPSLLISLFIEIIYSLAIVLAKYGMDNLYCSPYEITFYEGIFAFFMNIIFLVIASNIPIPLIHKYSFSKIFKVSEHNNKQYLDNFYTYYNSLDFIGVLLFIVVMAGRVVFNLFSHITIKHFTSSHVVLLLIMGEITLHWKEKSLSDALVTGGIFIIELFMLLVFCEIIELNFCGLAYNTRKNIEERATLSIYDENKNDTDSKDIGGGLIIGNEENLSFNNIFEEND